MALEIVSLVVALVAVITVVVLSILVVRTRTRGGDDALTTALADMRLSLAGRDGALDAKVSQLDTKIGRAHV